MTGYVAEGGGYILVSNFSVVQTVFYIAVYYPSIFTAGHSVALKNDQFTQLEDCRKLFIF